MNDQAPGFPPVLGTGEGCAGDVDDAMIWKSVERCGAALIRGLGRDPEVFYRFAGRFNRAFLTSPFDDRKTLRTNAEVQTVTLGGQALDLHFEYGSSPFRPDLLWLYCYRPASDGTGGETLVADGAEIFDRISREAQEALLARRIRHRTSVPRSGFDAMRERYRPFQTLLGCDLLESMRTNRDVSILRFDESNVTFEYCASPVARSNEGRSYICHAVSTDAYLRPTASGADDKFSVKTTWEDGSDIERDLIEEVSAASWSTTRSIRWRQGDCLVVNNNRVLHGRAGTTDPNRLLFILCSFSSRYAAPSFEENCRRAILS